MALSAAGFDEARAAIEAALTGGTRDAILDEVSQAKSFGEGWSYSETVYGLP